MYANGTKMSANDVRAIIDGFKSTGAFRDKNKVLIIDETQDLSPEALNALLEVMESPRPGQYIIANSMQKLKGSLAGAFESRTKKWKLKEPSLDMIYMYLAKMGLKLGLVTKDVKSTVTGCPDSFWLPENSPIMRIVENSDYSYRKALDLLEQAFEGELFTVEQLNEVLDFGSYDEMISTVEKLVNGTIDKVVLDTVVGSKYQDDFNLIYHILGNAEICRVFGKLSNDDRDAWKARQPLEISKGKYYPEVRDAFRELARLNNGFLRKGDWSMVMAQLVEKIRTPPPGITSTGRRATK
jgi:DNA polymerase III delta prime subunit